MQSAPSRTERPETEWPPARIVNAQPGARRGADRRGDVVGVAGVGDGGRAAVDGAVPAGARAVVVGVGRLDEAADEAARAQRGGERRRGRWQL